MLATVGTVLLTHDLALGVLIGVMLSGVFFAGKVSKMFRVTSEDGAGEATRIYRVEGQVFFASADSFVDAFDFSDVKTQHVTIDVSKAHLWDISAVGALDKVIMLFRQRGKVVDVIGLNQASASMIDRFASHDKNAEATVATH